MYDNQDLSAILSFFHVHQIHFAHINVLNLDDLIININSENIINTENGDFFNLLLNGYIIEILLNNPLFKNCDDYIKEEVFNLLNGYYK